MGRLIGFFVSQNLRSVRDMGCVVLYRRQARSPFSQNVLGMVLNHPKSRNLSPWLSALLQSSKVDLFVLATAERFCSDERKRLRTLLLLRLKNSGLDVCLVPQRLPQTFKPQPCHAAEQAILVIYATHVVLTQHIAVAFVGDHRAFAMLSCLSSFTIGATIRFQQSSIRRPWRIPTIW
jgi:hypothetical protein